MGTSVTAVDCDFEDNRQDNILVQTGAKVKLEGCVCQGAQSLHGVEVRDPETQVSGFCRETSKLYHANTCPDGNLYNHV